MDIKTAQEVLACLPVGKTPFYYCKDRYAVFLLSHIIGRKCVIADLKKSAYSGLLHKPLVKGILAQSGDGLFRQEHLALAWGGHIESFLLTLSIWGDKDRSWDQVSRNGYSLVLQLNFSNKHDAVFKRLAEPSEYHQFNCSLHPVLKRHQRDFFRETLAWARIDFDFKTNEALIEELQTDWLRRAKRLLVEIQSGKPRFYNLGTNAKPEQLRRYLEAVLADYGDIWDEALLTAALQFIRQELGIATIYMHTPDTGAAIKRSNYTQPPRSLYSSLPRKFCFSQTDKAPEFLYQNRAFRKFEKQLGGTQWNVINLGGNYADITKTATEKSGRPVTLVA
ncbi:MAG: hypothetical protein ACXWT4_14665 [Methylobacter sp.]